MEKTLKTERFQIVMTPGEREALREWRFANRINSESEAIRLLMRIGMKAVDEDRSRLYEARS